MHDGSVLPETDDGRKARALVKIIGCSEHIQLAGDRDFVDEFTRLERGLQPLEEAHECDPVTAVRLAKALDLRPVLDRLEPVDGAFLLESSCPVGFAYC